MQYTNITIHNTNMKGMKQMSTINNTNNLRNKEIKIRVTPDEYETIKHKAEMNHLNIAPYIRRELLSPTSFQVNPLQSTDIFNTMQSIINKYPQNTKLTTDFEKLYSILMEVYHV